MVVHILVGARRIRRSVQRLAKRWFLLFDRWVLLFSVKCMSFYFLCIRSLPICGINPSSGATLLSFLTLKELDKNNGGSIKFWIMFMVHRYIRFFLHRHKGGDQAIINLQNHQADWTLRNCDRSPRNLAQILCDRDSGFKDIKIFQNNCVLPNLISEFSNLSKCWILPKEVVDKLALCQQSALGRWRGDGMSGARMVRN